MQPTETSAASSPLPTLLHATAQEQSICKETKSNSSGLHNKLKETFNRFTEHQEKISF